MKNKMWKILGILSLLVALNLSFPIAATAQCPMCKMSAESNLQNGGTHGNGLNQGILYMLATPYLMVATIGFIWWKNRRKEEDELLEEM